MKTWSLLLIVVAVVAVVSLLSIWFVTSQTDFVSANMQWNGISKFQLASGAKEIQSLSDLPSSTGNTALISVPYQPYDDTEKARLRDFMSNGGTLLLADDFGYGNQFLEYLGVTARFDGRPLLDPLFCYRNAWLPKITDFSPTLAQNGINLVILNHATTLTNVGDIEILAWSSPTSFIDTNGDGQQGSGELSGVFPVAATMTFGNGRLVLLSDPSVILNGMTGDNNNYEFVPALVNLGVMQPMELVVDTSHLSKSPLDVSKVQLNKVKGWVSQPYPLLAIVTMIFISTAALVLRR